MQSPPISQTEIQSRISGHLDELLELWHIEQGADKIRDLELSTAIIPIPRDKPVRVLDLCCGPGDVGRAVHRAYPKAQIDGVDRDPFLTSICKGINERNRIPGKVLARDLNNGAWPDELTDNYDIVTLVNSLHWFDAESAAKLLTRACSVMRTGGVLLLIEPARAEDPFKTGFDEWKATQPQRYSMANWEKFWFRANEILGYDHIKLLGSRDDVRIGDDMTVAGWTDLVTTAGLDSVDVLLRDADQVIIAAMKE
jgi:trans-aconitate 2-methyltransferase